jgi:hypothetical protein
MYRDLCDFVHAGLVVTTTLKEQEAFVNSLGLQVLFRASLDMLWAADALFFADKPLRAEIIEIKKTCQDISLTALNI